MIAQGVRNATRLPEGFRTISGSTEPLFVKTGKVACVDRVESMFELGRLSY